MQTLILRIEKLDQAKGGYPLSLLSWSPPGAPVAVPDVPTVIIPGDLSVPGRQTLFTAQKMRELFADAAGPQPELQNIGAQLYDLLVQDSAIAEAIDAADRRILLDIRPTELKPLPWELLWREANQSPLFGDPARPIARLEDGPALPAGEWPLRMLIAIGSRARSEAVQAEHELEEILVALTPCDADIDVRLWKRGSKADLVKELQEFKPHIFHFIGHGQVDLNGKASLELFIPGSQSQQTSDRKELWEPIAVTNDVKFGSLRLVVINACRSAEAGDTPTVNRNGLWSVTDAFVAAGVPAVVGMRSDVAGEDAAHFAAAFYSWLAADDTIDVALAKGRQSVFQGRPDGLKRREWASPSLHVCQPPETILRIGEGIAKEQRRAFSKNRELVDRRLERHKAWSEMIGGKPNLYVIEGQAEVGKTRFAHMVMERCLLAGHDVRYVDLEEYINPDPIRRKGDFLTVLRAIRDGNASPRQVWRQPLPADKFAPFNRKVNEALGSAPPASQEDVDMMAELTAAAYPRAEEMIVTFRDCLEKAINHPPLVIVLDNLDSLLKKDFTDQLLPHLLEWCIGRDDINIRIVLLLTPDQHRDFRLRDLEGDFHHVTIPIFRQDDWEELAIEYVLRGLREADLTPEEKRERLTLARNFIPTAIGFHIKGDWKPSMLERLLLITSER